MERPEQRAVFDEALSLDGLNKEFLSEFPLHIIMIHGQVNKNVRRLVEIDYFWELWVKKHIFPRHTDELIRSVPGKMKWRYYARMHGRWSSSELYVAIKEGDQSRFFHHKSIPGITKALRVQSRLFLLIEGKLAMVGGITAKYSPTRAQEPLIWANLPTGEKFVDFVWSTPHDHGSIGASFRYAYLLTETGKIFVQKIWWQPQHWTPDRESITKWSDMDLKTTLIEEGIQGTNLTRTELIDCVVVALERRHVFDDLSPVELSTPHYVSQITPSHFLDEQGNLYPFHINYYDRKKLIVGQLEETGCLWVHSTALTIYNYVQPEQPKPETIIPRRLAEDSPRPLQIVSSSFRENQESMKLINSDWQATSDHTKGSNAYLYLSGAYTNRDKHTKLGVRSNLQGSLSLAQPRAKDKPIVAYGDHPVRGWSGRHAAWTTDGVLYTIGSSASAGNGVYEHSYSELFPQKKMRPAIGISDFVVGCDSGNDAFIALAVALPGSKEKMDAVSSLDEEAVRHLAKMLNYPSRIYDGSTSKMIDLLSREDKDYITAKLNTLERVSVVVKPLLFMGAADLSRKAKAENIPHFDAKTSVQLAYSIAQAAVAGEEAPSGKIRR